MPRSFAIIEERQDSWVKYPREPVGSVWLIRQPAGSDPPVLALQSECPHLGCAINLKADRTGFLCPCHTSAFTLDGSPTNQVPPRPMDRLEVEVTSGDDPEVRVKFQRFRTAIRGEDPPCLTNSPNGSTNGPASSRGCRRSRERTVPGGAGWRYVSGPALMAVFLVQAFTGLLLMASYSPSSSTAWGSVYYINYEMWLGWFIRGVHHYAAQATIVLLAFHLLQVALDRRLSPAPRVHLVVRRGRCWSSRSASGTPVTSSPGTRKATGPPRS